jgi:hypothetical protein
MMRSPGAVPDRAGLSVPSTAAACLLSRPTTSGITGRTPGRSRNALLPSQGVTHMRVSPSASATTAQAADGTQASRLGLIFLPWEYHA